MRFGPHTDTVERFLAALEDPAVRRRHLVPLPPDELYGHGRTVFERVLLAGRVGEWDDARLTAAKVAVPTQRAVAAGVALAVVASDLICDDVWDAFTDNPLGWLVGRPGGPLAGRCACGLQVGERLVRELANRQANPDRHVPTGPDCGHVVVPALPSPDALAMAFGLVHRWDGADWTPLLTLARRLAR